ncbi:MAG: hypothetical protein Q8L54_09530 [Devosia sp.]|nr:hypothetical protein [Devosia sp.]
MFIAPHIIETALLLLAAFLIGCAAGYLLRRLATGRARPAATPAAARAADVPAPQLVVAPRIAPLPVPAPVPAAMAAPEEHIAAMPKKGIQPARVAGETTSGGHIPAAAEAVVPMEISWSELSGRPAPPAPRGEEEDTEDAAMRAIEGNWTPRPAPRHSSARVELPEPAGATEVETATARIDGASAAEVAGAISSVRSAVAAAGAAAEAAIAGHLRAPEAGEEPVPAADEVSPKPGNRSPFGKPSGLDAPRDGRKDELRRIKGVTLQIEAALNDLGIFHFDQIAAWDRKAVVWIENRFALGGRIGRDRWIGQARELAKARGRAARAARR